VHFLPKAGKQQRFGLEKRGLPSSMRKTQGKATERGGKKDVYKKRGDPSVVFAASGLGTPPKT